MGLKPRPDGERYTIEDRVVVLNVDLEGQLPPYCELIEPGIGYQFCPRFLRREDVATADRGMQFLAQLPIPTLNAATRRRLTSATRRPPGTDQRASPKA